MDRFIDDPQYLTRGEKLKMETFVAEPERHSGRGSGGKGGSGFKDHFSQDSNSLIEAGYAISGATPFGMMPHQ